MDWERFVQIFTLVVYNVAILLLIRTAVAGVRAVDVVRDKNPATLRAAAALAGEDRGAAGADPSSFSRLAGVLGMLVLACFLWALGNVLLYKAFRHAADIPNIVRDLGPFFLGGSALFAPYAFNQLKEVFQTSPDAARDGRGARGAASQTEALGASRRTAGSESRSAAATTPEVTAASSVPGTIQEFIREGRPNRPGTRIRPTSITIHNTDNPANGADAKAHSRFVREKGYYELNGEKHWVSWHFTVDDRVAIQQLPINEKAFHAGPANSSSLAVEICMNQGIDQDAADQRAAELVAALLQSLGLGVDDVRTHQSWTGKRCPTLLLQGEGWQRFLNRVRDAFHPNPGDDHHHFTIPREMLTAAPEGEAAH